MGWIAVGHFRVVTDLLVATTVNIRISLEPPINSTPAKVHGINLRQNSNCKILGLKRQQIF